jgi:hypothetical protein
MLVICNVERLVADGHTGGDSGRKILPRVVYSDAE